MQSEKVDGERNTGQPDVNIRCTRSNKGDRCRACTAAQVEALIEIHQRRQPGQRWTLKLKHCSVSIKIAGSSSSHAMFVACAQPSIEDRWCNDCRDGWFGNGRRGLDGSAGRRNAQELPAGALFVAMLTSVCPVTRAQIQADAAVQACRRLTVERNRRVDAQLRRARRAGADRGFHAASSARPSACCG